MLQLFGISRNFNIFFPLRTIFYAVDILLYHKFYIYNISNQTHGLTVFTISGNISHFNYVLNMSITLSFMKVINIQS